MNPDWRPLDVELNHWRAESLPLPLWWRDDDAVAPSPALEQLSALSHRLGLPVHLAIIPEQAQPELATYLQEHPELIPLVHGWSHQNHAQTGQKKCEFPDQRSIDEALQDIEAGLARLQSLFGGAALPIFVPPWNRISADLLPWLAGAGFSALSTFTPRKTPKAAPGLWQINCHLDPIDWRGSRSLYAPEQLISQVVQHLRDRRLDRADNKEPYGILTHHLVHDAAIWHFTEALLDRLLTGPGRVWSFENENLR